jgi:hypothetical protein
MLDRRKVEAHVRNEGMNLSAMAWLQEKADVTIEPLPEQDSPDRRLALESIAAIDQANGPTIHQYPQK